MERAARCKVAWVVYRGSSKEDSATSSGREGTGIEDVAFRDPDMFVAGGLHEHANEWECILCTVKGT